MLAILAIACGIQAAQVDGMNNSISGPAPLYEIYLREKFKLPSTERIESLKFSSDRSLSVTGYWLDVCATTKRGAEFSRKEVSINESKLSEFIGFLQGRTLHPLDPDWLAGLRSAKASKDTAMTFPYVDRITTKKHVVEIITNPGVEVVRDGERIAIKRGERRVSVSEPTIRRVFSEDLSMPIYFADVHFLADSAIVAFASYNATRGAVALVKHNNEIAWITDVYCDFLPVRNGPQLEVNYAIKVTYAEGRAVLYGLHTNVFFLEEFDLAKGKPELRFSTSLYGALHMSKFMRD